MAWNELKLYNNLNITKTGQNKSVYESIRYYLIFGFSAKITLTAGTVLGVLYGGNTAIAVNPTGTRERAEIRVWGLAMAPPPKIAVGGAPPPRPPGGVFPKTIDIF